MPGWSEHLYFLDAQHRAMGIKDQGKRGILHQAQSQHLAVEHPGLFRLCRCSEGDNIAVSKHLETLLLRYPPSNEWSSVSVPMKLPAVERNAPTAAIEFVHARWMPSPLVHNGILLEGIKVSSSL